MELPVEIEKVEFERDVDGEVVFTKENVALLQENIIPIIEKNPGWGTENLTSKDFKKHPKKYWYIF